MSIEELKKMKLDTLLKVDASKLTTEEVAYVEKRLVQSANRRIKRLRESGKIGLSNISKREKRGFSTYKTPKGYKPKSSTKGVYVKTAKKKGRRNTLNVRNKRISNVSKMQEFLSKKTSTVKGIETQLERYKNVIKNTTGFEGNITDRQAKRISKLMERAREMGISNDANKKNSGSPRLLSMIVDIVKAKKYIRNDEAEQIIAKAIEEGYQEAQKTISKLRQEDAEGLDIDEEDEEDTEDYEAFFDLF